VNEMVNRILKYVQSEIRVRAAETLAMQHILSNVLSELKLIDPQIAGAISRGFDNATRQLDDRLVALIGDPSIEDNAIKAGKSVPPEHLIKTVAALGVVEELRTASLGRSGRSRPVRPAIGAFAHSRDPFDQHGAGARASPDWRSQLHSLFEQA
jgi:hypothetical protein